MSAVMCSGIERSETSFYYLHFSPHSQSNVFMYYGLSNFYQNHRRYVKSRDDSQLNGDLSSLKVRIQSVDIQMIECERVPRYQISVD